MEQMNRMYQLANLPQPDPSDRSRNSRTTAMTSSSRTEVVTLYSASKIETLPLKKNLITRSVEEPSTPTEHVRSIIIKSWGVEGCKLTSIKTSLCESVI